MTEEAAAEPSSGPLRRSDAALVRAAKLGEESAFEEIVARYGPGMYRYALRLVGGSDSDAADVTQDALISAWRSLESYAGRSGLRSWLYRLVHRRAVDLLRTRRPVPVPDDLDGPAESGDGVDPAGLVVEDELVALLQQCLNQLPWIQRAVWLLREVEQMSYDEMAEALGVPVGSVRGHLYRARQAVTERMARWR